MNKKVIALGNRLMMDDKIALLVSENLLKVFTDNNIEVIIGETDVDYCLSKLNCEDEFYIIDSTYFGDVAGTITTRPLSDIKKAYKYQKQAHSLNLLDLINIYDIDVKGYFIGIEIQSIKMHYGISVELQEIFQSICSEILKIIV
ncbi:MAG: hydrogenase maturation protease [Clostridiaceae bacterium]|nr:hydrogenase maturation protease [Clostridiaceae bacterium]